jgi:putative peptidoglycan lipid II flippase
MAAPLAIVAYPQFAQEALRENHGQLAGQVSRMFRLVLFIFIPVTIWTLFNALPVTRLLYERGHFRFEDSILTARVFSFYAIGILPNAIAVILLPCLYAVHDTVTPLWVECVDLIFYLAVAIFLMSHFGLSGLAFSRGVQFYLVAVLLMFVLHRRSLLRMDFELLKFSLRVGLASAAMATIGWICFYPLQTLFDSGKTPLRLGVVLTVMAASAVSFLAVANLMKFKEVGYMANAALDLLPWRRSAAPNTALRSLIK